MYVFISVQNIINLKMFNVSGICPTQYFSYAFIFKLFFTDIEKVLPGVVIKPLCWTLSGYYALFSVSYITLNGIGPIKYIKYA